MEYEFLIDMTVEAIHALADRALPPEDLGRMAAIVAVSAAVELQNHVNTIEVFLTENGIAPESN